jgi:hypothetical protein
VLNSLNYDSYDWMIGMILGFELPPALAGGEENGFLLMGFSPIEKGLANAYCVMLFHLNPTPKGVGNSYFRLCKISEPLIFMIE